MTCVTPNGQRLVAGANYTIQATANYKCNNRASSAVTSRTIAVDKPAEVSLVRQGPARLSVCTGGGPGSVSVTHKFEILNAAALSVSVNANAQGVNCAYEVRRGRCYCKPVNC